MKSDIAQSGRQLNWLITLALPAAAVISVRVRFAYLRYLAEHSSPVEARPEAASKSADGPS